MTNNLARACIASNVNCLILSIMLQIKNCACMLAATNYAQNCAGKVHQPIVHIVAFITIWLTNSDYVAAIYSSSKVLQMQLASLFVSYVT